MLDQLNQISKLAKGSKIRRLLHNPSNYLSGLFFSKITYNRIKKGKLATCQTIFDYPMTVILPASMDIYLLGGKGHDSEIRLAKLMNKSLKKGSNFIDVGAHFGYFSLMASKIVGATGKVISIEASQAITEVLTQNTAPYSNINQYHLACQDTAEELSFFEFPILFSEYNTLHPDQYEGTDWIKTNPPQEIKVQGKSLDDLLRELKVVPNFIKIDVEGAEHKVALGMVETLQNNQDLTIAMEYLEDARDNISHKKATKTITDAGYHAHVINKDGGLEKIDRLEIANYLKTHGMESDNVVFRRV